MCVCVCVNICLLSFIYICIYVYEFACLYKCICIFCYTYKQAYISMWCQQSHKKLVLCMKMRPTIYLWCCTQGFLKKFNKRIQSDATRYFVLLFRQALRQRFIFAGKKKDKACGKAQITDQNHFDLQNAFIYDPPFTKQKNIQFLLDTIFDSILRKGGKITLGHILFCISTNRKKSFLMISRLYFLRRLNQILWCWMTFSYWLMLYRKVVIHLFIFYLFIYLFDIVNISISYLQPLRSGRIWHKVNF